MPTKKELEEEVEEVYLFWTSKYELLEAEHEKLKEENKLILSELGKYDPWDNTPNIVSEFDKLKEEIKKLKEERDEALEEKEQYSQDADRATEAEAELEKLKEENEKLKEENITEFLKLLDSMAILERENEKLKKENEKIKKQSERMKECISEIYKKHEWILRNKFGYKQEELAAFSEDPHMGHYTALLYDIIEEIIKEQARIIELEELEEEVEELKEQIPAKKGKKLSKKDKEVLKSIIGAYKIVCIAHAVVEQPERVAQFNLLDRLLK